MAKKVYYKPKGAADVVEYLIDEIDADDAVHRFPKEYSFAKPDNVPVKIEMTPQLVAAKGNAPLSEHRVSA